MPSIYHQIPRLIEQPILQPLNILKESQPEIYEQAVSKYKDHPTRIDIPLREIIVLECTWGDVLQFCPVHPHIIAKAMGDAGMSIPNIAFYEIPIDRVARFPAAMYFGMGGNPRYSPIDWAEFAELTFLPKTTIDWYGHLAVNKLSGAMFHGIPHVMIKGQVDIEGCNVIAMRT